MNLRRGLLIFNGLAFFGYGIACVLVPEIVGEYSQIGLQSTTAIIEVTAMYGGLQTGLGLVFLACALRSHLVVSGLLAMVATMGGLGLARGYGLVATASIDWYNALAFTFEIGSVVLAIVALVKPPVKGVAVEVAPPPTKKSEPRASERVG